MIHELFERAAENSQEHPAVVFGDEQFTYRALNEQATLLANVILKEAPEAPVIAVSTNRSIQMIVSVIAILKAGKAYLPLDPTYPSSRLEQIIADSGVKTLVCTQHETETFTGKGLQLLISDVPATFTAGLTPVQGQNACILYTSGSTGKPKGVCLGHDSLSNFLNWQTEHALSGLSVKALQFCHLSFDASFQEIFLPLTTGGTLYLITDNDRLDGGRLLDFLIRHSLNKVFLPYVTLQYLSEAAVAENRYPQQLKEVITGGELLKITPAISSFFGGLPDSIFLNIYGPTEATICVTTLKLSGNPDLWPAIPTIGSPMANAQVFFLDEALNLVENGQSGELCISGACLANGYLNQPELTAEKFITWTHPKLGQIRIYKTGDLGKYLENGEIEFHGRKDGQVKIRGNRVELGEIEVVIARQPDIRQAVMLVREDIPGRKMLVAYIVGDQNKQDTLHLRKTIAALLPDYMIPDHFVWLDELPKTSSGKVDKKALPKPELNRPELNIPYQKAGTQIEKDIALVFREVLQYDKIGIHDNFFELGGNSLLAQKTVTELRYRFKFELPVTRLYQYPTIAGIAAFLEKPAIQNIQKHTAQHHTAEGRDIAIIGMTSRFPGADNTDDLWQLLIDGRETTTFFEDTELDPTIPETLKNDPAYVKARGVIVNAGLFEPAFFGINPKLAELMDPQQRIFLEIAWEVLEQTGNLHGLHNYKTGVFAGCGSNTYYEYNVLANPALIENQGRMQVLTVNEKDYIASRTAYHLDLKGPAVSVNSACSTSLLAIAEAVNSLRAGQCDLALAGGASVTVPVNSGHLYQEGSMLSADGHCRPFDDDATGTVFSDGAGVVLLKRLADAKRDGDQIYALIKGTGVNNDGSGKGSFTAPSTEGQAEAISSAIADAGIHPADISYVESHGTGTPIGDPIEFEGLKAAFGPVNKNQYCAIGSIKSNFGHLTQAAGVAGVIKTALSLHHKKIPASLGYHKPNRHIDFANSPFYVNTKLNDWPANAQRIAGVSSFGVGGTNVHIILEGYENEPSVSDRGRSATLVTWSANTAVSRENYAVALKNYIESQQELNINDLAASLQQSRPDFRYRRFTVATSQGELQEILQNEPAAANTAILEELPGEVIFSFPGQGAQYLNMARTLYETEAVYRDAVDTCATILTPYLDIDIREVIFTDHADEAAAARLRDTRYTQPALFVTEYALGTLWINWGIIPTMFVGHSIGEYVAAHFSGVFSLADGLKLIAKRGALISALPAGSMLSVRKDAETISAMLSGSLSLAAINSPTLCVVAGPTAEITAFSGQLEAQGIANKQLFTSHAFHSQMMDPILEDFRKEVASVTLSAPTIPILSTVTGMPLIAAEATAIDYWTMHLRKPVRFAAAIENILVNTDTPLFLETGPGTVTSTLIRQIAGMKNIPVKVFSSLNGTTNDTMMTLTALGQLWSNGLKVNWANFYAGQSRRFLQLPTYQFNRNKYWVNGRSLNHAESTHQIITLTQPNQQDTVNELIMRKNNLTSKIKQVLEDASGIEMNHVGADRNFLEIGLDSLLLTQVAISLKKEFKLPITFRKLNEEYPTIEALVNYIADNTPDDTPATVSVPVTNNYPVDNYAANPVTATAFAPANNSALGLIAQQLEILSKQVMLMQGGQPAPVLQQQPIVQSTEPELSNQEAAEIKKPFGATPKIERHASDLDPAQAQFLKELTIRYNQKTIKSKNYAAESRPYMADPRVVSGFKPQTKELIYPIVINKSSGSKMWDVDGNEYIDVLNGFGSNLLGYQPEPIKKAMHEQIDKGYEVGPQHELAAEVSKLVCEFTGFDRAALCSTGSEAVLGCIRIARTVTGRSLLVAFSGSYHGIIDEVLVRGTKKLKSFPAAAGIMPEAVQNILVLDYGTDEALDIIRERADEIAAVLIEPIQSRRPEFVPVDFLKEVRKITTESGAAMIFDEVITGFRMHPGGAQALFDIRVDLASYGKVVGAGIPIGVIAGKKAYMDALDGGSWTYGDQSFPEVGVTYFAGTFVRHPLALASAKASLEYLKAKGPELQATLNKKGDHIATSLNREIEKRKLPFFVANYGSLWKVKFNEEIPYSELMFTLMREKGIHILDGFPCFVTEATSDEDIEKIISNFIASMDEMIAAGFFPEAAPDQNHHQRNGVVVQGDQPPVPGAKLGKDSSGNPAWFIQDPNQDGKYLQIGTKA